MEPRIQYAKTSDGVSIAYYAIGRGMPVVVTSPVGWSHLQLEWRWPGMRRWYEGLAEKRMVVRYDTRGCGLSERNIHLAGPTPAFAAMDLEAIAGALGLETFALFGSLHFGRAAIAYAAEHPGRVSHLVLWCTYAGRLQRLPGVETATALLDKDWEMYTETLARVSMGWAAGEEAHDFATYIRESITEETYKTILSAFGEYDAGELLPQIETPTLVLQRRQVILPDVSFARELASRIPDARLALLEGDSYQPFEGDMEAVLAAIDEFLREGEEGVSSAKQPAGEDIHTIFFTDIEGSTALTERLGDAGAQQLRRAHDTIVREALKGCGGTETKHTGDGIMASFPSASRSIECAVAVQRAIADRGDATLRVRIGLNAGEPVAEEADLFGTAVNLARRICDRAEPGQILVSDVVHQLAAGKGFTFADNGEATLKGFEKPVRVYEVRWQD